MPRIQPSSDVEEANRTEFLKFFLFEIDPSDMGLRKHCLFDNFFYTFRIRIKQVSMSNTFEKATFGAGT